MPLKEKDYTNDEGLKDKSLLLDDMTESEKIAYKLNQIDPRCKVEGCCNIEKRGGYCKYHKHLMITVFCNKKHTHDKRCMQ